MRVPVFAVGETVVFVLGGERMDALLTAGVVLIVTIAARFAWVMAYTAIKRRLVDRAGKTDAIKPTFGSAVVVSWTGMRGIVALAAAFAIPDTLSNGRPFPYRDHMLMCAFAVVLGMQGDHRKKAFPRKRRKSA
jgi:NhaP-type Na+/H+ or K+/H+ antiporter